MLSARPQLSQSPKSAAVAEVPPDSTERQQCEAVTEEIIAVCIPSPRPQLGRPGIRHLTGSG